MTGRGRAAALGRRLACQAAGAAPAPASGRPGGRWSRPRRRREWSARPPRPPRPRPPRPGTPRGRRSGPASRWPATDRVAPTATTAVVSTATPTALPSWRPTLNIVEARPVASGEIVANAAAWAGTKTWAMPTPSANISSRIHHRLVCAPTRLISPIEAATPTRPSAMLRRGPSPGTATGWPAARRPSRPAPRERAQPRAAAPTARGRPGSTARPAYSVPMNAADGSSITPLQERNSRSPSSRRSISGCGRAQLGQHQQPQQHRPGATVRQHHGRVPAPDRPLRHPVHQQRPGPRRPARTRAGRTGPAASVLPPARNSSPKARAARPIGTFTKNTQRHDSVGDQQPAEHRAERRGQRGRHGQDGRRAHPLGGREGAEQHGHARPGSSCRRPTPCSTRKTTSSVSDARPARTAPTPAVKTTMAVSSTRLPPNRSPSQPDAGMKTARLTRKQIDDAVHDVAGTREVAADGGQRHVDDGRVSQASFVTCF